MNDSDTVLKRINQKDRRSRLDALREVVDQIRHSGQEPQMGDEVNNHVHTIYSFSPYSPTAIAYQAWQAGLKAVGSVDHDSASAGRETIEACKIIGMASTVGFEMRVNMNGTAVEGRKTNNPDSHNISYIAIHGIPANHIHDAEAFLEPLHRERNRRNERMVDGLNRQLQAKDFSKIHFVDDVYDASMAHEGGSITERHIMAAVARHFLREFPSGKKLTAMLGEKLDLHVSGSLKGYLEDESNPHRIYDLLGILKSSFLPGFFIQPDTQECIGVKDAIDFATSIHAIPAYAYLGDVTASPTGDKKAEKFEDEYLDLLMDEVQKLGFLALTYMPPRNTVAQLLRVQRLCQHHGLMEISGVDINSSRQSFNCPEILQPEFRHLVDTTWALIANEKICAHDPNQSLFNRAKSIGLQRSIEEMARIGATMDHRHPEIDPRR